MINKNTPSCNRAISFESIFSYIGIRQLLSKAKFNKRSGADTFTLLSVIITSIFKGYPNLYRFFESKEGKLLPFSRDAVYRFMNEPKYDWQALMLNIATFSTKFISTLNRNNKEQINCFIVDDTILERARGKKIELLSRQFNHVTGKCVKSFTNLALGWSDGISYIPVLSYLIASAKEKNIIQKADTHAIDKRYSGAKRRAIACKKKPEVLIHMCKSALRCIRASHILMDSWFFSDNLLRELQKLGLHSICMVKSNLQFKLLNDDSKSYTQQKLLNIINKGNSTKGRLVTSIIAKTNKGLIVKIVFVKARNFNNFIAIVSTDTSLSDEQIVTLYGRRWSIEVAFKAQKSYLGLKSECQGHKFDTCNALMVVSYIRLQIMELNRRHDNDPRSIGELFFTIKSELTAITFAEALQSLLSLIDNLAGNLVSAGCLSKDKLAKAKEIIADHSGLQEYLITLSFIYSHLSLLVIKKHIFKEQMWC